MRYQASPQLVEAIRKLAPRFIATAHAPNTYAGIKAQFETWQRTGAPVEVWDGGSDKTIWPTPQANHAFRAFHDLMHFFSEAPLTPEGERQVAAQTMRYLSIHCGHVLTWNDYRCMYAEVVGQVQYEQKFGKFPEDQAAFVYAYMLRGKASLDREY